MDFSSISDADVCMVIGYRVKIERLRLNLTQAVISETAGVSLRTYKRFEARGVCSAMALVGILRAINRLRVLEIALPAPALRVRESPVQIAERLRKRARSRPRA